MSIHDKDPGIDYDGDTNIFYEPFREALSRLNGQDYTGEQIKSIVKGLRAALSADDLGRAFFNYLHEGFEGAKLIELETPANNVFLVVTELPYANVDDSFRPDVVFLVNGMPLGFMEAKRPNNQEGILAERDRMYARFGNDIYKRFVNITQIMAFSNNQEYTESCRPPIQGSYYASSAYGKVLLQPFREEDEQGVAMLLADRSAETEQFILKDNNLASYYGAPEYEPSTSPDTPANRIITSLFSPERFLFLLRYGIAYVERTTEEGTKKIEKHVMRYPQLFATFAMRKKLDEGMRKGTIWHTQGSGKTALSFFLSRYLQDYYQQHGQVARFFFIVDRIDLADQAAGEFEARNCNVQRVNSRKEFQKAIASPSERGADSASLTITVVNIQKFDDEAQAENFDYALNVQRVFFIDEAHRDYKNGGKFLTQLVTSDRDAVRIALTGTPLIGKTGGNNTREVFGDYSHRYWYNHSIADV
ncbi:MAG: type I restriction endonuclease subunit R [Eggerthellaceae bacterium]|nr:type I restriction endonuclease subunit R [Eggerthellaceae bacterium]